MGVSTEFSHLWCDSPSDRIKNARVLSQPDLALIHEYLCEGCPVPVWPPANATSINPMLITLGVSPGASPNLSHADPSGNTLKLPTAGIRHPHTHYQDTRGYWRKVRLLASTVLHTETSSDEDTYALFGNMNLSIESSGNQRDVQIDPIFAEWVLRTIRDKLRPKYLVCLGLKSSEEAKGLLSRVFKEFNSHQPQATFRLECYKKKRYEFQEWDCEGDSGNQVKLVFWPQHPSRAPLTRDSMWAAACQEFADRHQDLVTP